MNPAVTASSTGAFRMTPPPDYYAGTNPFGVVAPTPPAIAVPGAKDEDDGAPEGYSKAAKIVAGAGTTGFVAIIIALDQFLSAHGELASSMLNKLGPVFGPLWANYPILILLGAFMILGIVAYNGLKKDRRADAKQRKQEFSLLAVQMTGVKSEIHNLRADMQQQATLTNERFRDVETDLRSLMSSEDLATRELIRNELQPLKIRLGVLEAGRTKSRNPRPPTIPPGGDLG